MFEVTCVRDPKTHDKDNNKDNNKDNDNDAEEEEEEKDIDEAPMEQYVWCIARRYRQFEELRRSLQSAALRKVQVPKKGWLWSTSTDVTLVNERLKVTQNKNKQKILYILIFLLCDDMMLFSCSTSSPTPANIFLLFFFF
jgi:hypothetical protein